MRKPGLAAQVELLRVRLETTLPDAAIVVVSSARNGDGSLVVAAELARSFDAAGHRTLLVMSESERSSPATRRPQSLAEIVDLGVEPFVSGSSNTHGKTL